MDCNYVVPLQAAQYDTTTHVKTPASATPTQPFIYSQLNRFKEIVKGDGEYQQLDHIKGDKVNDHKKTPPPTEEYGTLKVISTVVVGRISTVSTRAYSRGANFLKSMLHAHGSQSSVVVVGIEYRLQI